MKKIFPNKEPKDIKIELENSVSFEGFKEMDLPNILHLNAIIFGVMNEDLYKEYKNYIINFDVKNNDESYIQERDKNNILIQSKNKENKDDLVRGLLIFHALLVH